MWIVKLNKDFGLQVYITKLLEYKGLRTYVEELNLYPLLCVP